ncbi:YdiK family protein [Anaerobacillus sp. CMMVII]|uniref:YdiK family protein n=1 Tax=Anaerobacillus sp. CMMVII TaxID=2755588 RepID=UPI0021B72BDB|nr:YdiK family protein [Anaerobacillus sp. CMMVII]MCT8136596.1 YdiK family protein [Anaerobacillus sp. CMMVII]
MRSPLFWGTAYLLMGASFVFFAIQQRGRTGEWDLFTIALMAIATYDFVIAIRYFTFKPKAQDK